MKKRSKVGYQPTFTLESSSFIDCEHNDCTSIVTVCVNEVPDLSIAEQIAAAPKKYRGKGKAEITNISENEIMVVNGLGDITRITKKEVKVSGATSYVVEVVRDYVDGGSHAEPAHYWDNNVKARMDMADWAKLAKLSDW